MSDAIEQQALELFETLAELESDERAERLRALDAEVRPRVEALLRADARAEGLLDRGADEHLADMAVADGARREPPETVGAYRVVERLGEGGMADVYLAERRDADFEQQVALKLISPLRHTEHWEQRFVQERQILASLQHPNIATLYDGGISDEGRPYFAMEFVDGLPITEYCDNQRLTIRARLRLLLAVCDAVRYAHGNLIVHRDLKPSNILVDTQGQPRLLDFGIAKILSDEDGAADSSRTQTSLRALTPDYAAPEQFVGGPVTTAVDVYALGGLLFELLCGRRPFARLASKAVDIEREVRERGAPAFSRATAEMAEGERERIAAARGLSWRRLTRSIEGDLENIALMALRPEPERRYATVDALAADLQSYLDGQPVKARADTVSYRLRKFASRHPVGLPLGALAAVALVAASTVALLQAREAETAASIARLEAARANETRDFVTSLFEFASPDKSLGEQLTARQLLDLGAARIDQQLAGQPLLQAEMSLLLANTYGQLGLYETALPLATGAAETYAENELDNERRKALVSLARLYRQAGDFAASDERLAAAAALRGSNLDSALLVERGELLREQAAFDDARSAFEAALALDRERLAPPTDVARDLYRLGTLEFSVGDSEQGLDLLRQAAAVLDDNGGADSTQFASIRHDIGVMLIQRGELDAAREVLESVLARRARLLGDRHPDVAGTNKELAGIARQQDRSEDAERLYLTALEINEAMLGPSHPETANTLNSLAVFYRGLGNDSLALEFALRALTGARAAYGDSHPTVGLMTVNAGSMQRMLGQLDDALASTQQGLDILRGVLGEEHQLAGVAYNAVAGVQHDRSEHAPAEANYRRALDIFEKTAGENHPHIVSILNGLGTLLVDVNRLGEAEAALRRAADIAQGALPPAHPNTAIVQVGLARVAALTGRCDEAERLLGEYGAVAAAPATAARAAVARRDVGAACN